MRFTIIITIFGMAAVMALPGVAGQEDGALSPQARLAAMQADFGLAVDPHAAAALSIQLPTGFTTLDMSADPFQG